MDVKRLSPTPPNIHYYDIKRVEWPCDVMIRHARLGSARIFGARMLAWGAAGGDPYRATDGSILVRMPAPDLLMGSRPRAVPPAPLVSREFFSPEPAGLYYRRITTEKHEFER